mmetsp:Transcript_51987/g.86218  ORF Transcript_51987/g.86218 Transcript_51987/m.86218 type:complete len:264 (+) Transcript_51987:156-947(+)|eukprot:CAMPEP_0119312432 /NCGR_PEP_ID=MMETSP1333-20130426/26434_1 /TAXON_ID=418940 /ORGANISM="Scyphosphaera apsteinii, Strain RCC1455" /LENGTH=263 /DNA_ID=CAMNT_0007317053 /DNA_START=154 /DNA_END=945 /DNA_ORIENTATION=+
MLFLSVPLMLPSLTDHSWGAHKLHLRDKRFDFAPQGLRTWHDAAIKRLRDLCSSSREQAAGCALRDLYSFGVYTGRSMKGIAIAMNTSRIPFRRFFGFDSFEGLPEESAATVRSSISQRQWFRGSWSVADVLADYDVDSVKQKLLDYINEPRVELVAGYYNESLHSTLPKERDMHAALFVEIDCDLYLSSLQALDFMLSQKLIVKGTLIGYDDYDTGGTGGEARAHHEMVLKYKLKLKAFSIDKSAPWARIFMVLSDPIQPRR